MREAGTPLVGAEPISRAAVLAVVAWGGGTAAVVGTARAARDRLGGSDPGEAAATDPAAGLDRVEERSSLSEGDRWHQKQRSQVQWLLRALQPA